jgi:hypothetical protein
VIFGCSEYLTKKPQSPHGQSTFALYCDHKQYPNRRAPTTLDGGEIVMAEKPIIAEQIDLPNASFLAKEAANKWLGQYLSVKVGEPKEGEPNAKAQDKAANKGAEKKKDELPPLTGPTDEKGREIKERKFHDAKVRYVKFPDGKFRPTEVLLPGGDRTVFSYDDKGKLTGYDEQDERGFRRGGVPIDVSRDHLTATVSDAGVLEIKNIYTGATWTLPRKGEWRTSLGLSLKADPEKLEKSKKEEDRAVGFLLTLLSSTAFKAQDADDAKKLAADYGTVADALEKAGYKDDAATLRKQAKGLEKKD